MLITDKEMCIYYNLSAVSELQQLHRLQKVTALRNQRVAAERFG